MIRLLLYYVPHTLKNMIKKAWKTWLVVGVIILAFFAFTLGSSLFFDDFDEDYEDDTCTTEEGSSASSDVDISNEDISFSNNDTSGGSNLSSDNDSDNDYLSSDVDSGSGNSSSDDNSNGDDAYEDDEIEYTAEDIREIKLVVKSVIALVLFLFLLWAVDKGQQNGAEIFTMADVNLLFAAPLKPQSLLMFRVILHMGAVIVGSFYLIFQIPNLVLNIGITAGGVCVIICAYLIALVTVQLVRVCSYTFFATHSALRRYVSPATKLLAAAVFLLCGLTFLTCGRDLFRAMDLLFGSGWSNCIPVIGFLKAAVMYGVDGSFLRSVLFLALSVLFLALVAVVTWRMKADFYEDAFTGAARQQEALAEIAPASGGSTVAVTNVAVTEEQRKKLQKKREAAEARASRKAFAKGLGANVFFFKAIHLRNRNARLGIFTDTASFYLFLMVIVSLFVRLLAESDSFIAPGVIVCICVYFRTYGNPIASELSEPYLYMVPESAYSKVAFSFLAGSVSAALDLLPGFAAGFLILGSLPDALAWYIFAVSIDFCASAWGLTLGLALPDAIPGVLRAWLELLLKLLTFLPCLFVGLLFGVFLGIDAALFVIAVLDFLIGTGVGSIAPAFLRMEK
ncbi:MAG: putative ABC exporter domain-containing protein [Lachnospiraceae bacterium]|nr:putative ABC exporter domain-containing protein [Lachnospiraceae bacterium]